MAGAHRTVVAWQQAMALATEVYKVTASFPDREMYGLTRQVRNAAASVASNIAEGKGRRTRRDYVAFLFRARGSLYEMETQLEIARNVGYLEQQRLERLLTQSAEAGRTLGGLIRSLESRLDDDPKKAV